MTKEEFISWRKSRGLSQAEMAAIIKTSLTTVQRMERGTTPVYPYITESISRYANDTDLVSSQKDSSYVLVWLHNGRIRTRMEHMLGEETLLADGLRKIADRLDGQKST
jgi:transcriptional regulator with XRE-family HTH domain